MIVQFKRTIEQRGDEYVVTISREEAERSRIREGQQAYLVVPEECEDGELSPELREAFEATWREHEAVIRAIGPE